MLYIKVEKKEVVIGYSTTKWFVSQFGVDALF